MATDPSHRIIKVSGAIRLELTEETHAEPLLNLVNANRQHLKQWLPWVDHIQTLGDFSAYIIRCKQQHEEGTDVSFVIMMNDSAVGRIGIHHIKRQNSFGAIGYWLGEAFEGKGIITKSCIALINYCFTVLQLNRIELKCGVGNYRSAAIPERLNFTKEGVLRQAEWVNGKFIDLNLYSLLKEEWKHHEQSTNRQMEQGQN